MMDQVHKLLLQYVIRGDHRNPGTPHSPIVETGFARFILNDGVKVMFNEPLVLLAAASRFDKQSNYTEHGIVEDLLRSSEDFPGGSRQ